MWGWDTELAHARLILTELHLQPKTILMGVYSRGRWMAM